MFMVVNIADIFKLLRQCCIFCFSFYYISFVLKCFHSFYIIQKFKVFDWIRYWELLHCMPSNSWIYNMGKWKGMRGPFYAYCVLYIMPWIYIATMYDLLRHILDICLVCLFVCLMVFNATFNNISVISWRSVFYWWRKPEDPEKTPTCHKSLTTIIT